MPEYGDYKKEIKTLGDLREFANVTLKGLEDDYTFTIDDDWTGVDITLCANCDVSYSEREFYWSTNSHWYSELEEVVNKKIKLELKAKAFDIMREKYIDFEFLKWCSENNKDYEYYIAHLEYEETLAKEEYELIMEALKNE